MRASNGQQRPKGNKVLRDSFADALAQFDIVIPDGAYVISAHLQMMVPQESDKFLNREEARNFVLHVSATDILEGKVFELNDFAKPKDYLQERKQSKSFRRQNYGGIKVNIDEPIIFDVTQIIPFELNDEPLFDGTLSFVLFSIDTHVHAYDQRPILRLILQHKGTSFNCQCLYDDIYVLTLLTIYRIHINQIYLQ